jgi:hypothetical protein
MVSLSQVSAEDRSLERRWKSQYTGHGRQAIPKRS